jgi:hypothetical protein
VVGSKGNERLWRLFFSAVGHSNILEANEICQWHMDNVLPVLSNNGWSFVVVVGCK